MQSWDDARLTIKYERQRFTLLSQSTLAASGKLHRTGIKFCVERPAEHVSFLSSPFTHHPSYVSPQPLLRFVWHWIPSIPNVEPDRGKGLDNELNTLSF